MSGAREAATASPCSAVTLLMMGRMSGWRASLRRPLLDRIKRIYGQVRLAQTQLVTSVTETEYGTVLAMIGQGATQR